MGFRVLGLARQQGSGGYVAQFRALVSGCVA